VTDLDIVSDIESEDEEAGNRNLQPEPDDESSRPASVTEVDGGPAAQDGGVGVLLPLLEDAENISDEEDAEETGIKNGVGKDGVTLSEPSMELEKKEQEKEDVDDSASPENTLDVEVRDDYFLFFLFYRIGS